MKRQKQKAKRTNRTETSSTAGHEAPKKAPPRREFLRSLRSWGLLAAAVGAGGWYVVQEVGATIREHDLSRIGNGVPAVVQIHDPQCPRCIALQNEAREALSDFDGDELQFLVANIRSDEGRDLASAPGVAPVTLLLFDAEGRRRTTLTGPNTSEVLKQAFRHHVTSYGSN